MAPFSIIFVGEFCVTIYRYGDKNTDFSGNYTGFTDAMRNALRQESRIPYRDGHSSHKGVSRYLPSE